MNRSAFSFKKGKGADLAPSPPQTPVRSIRSPGEMSSCFPNQFVSETFNYG